MKLIAVILAGAIIAIPAQAQPDGEHDHSHAVSADVAPVSQLPEQGPHAGHAMPAASDGAWSYRGRNNPKPHVDGRVEVVPMGDQMQYVAADGLSPQERCAALLADAHMAVDRATRAACNGAKPAQPPADPHAGHAH